MFFESGPFLPYTNLGIDDPFHSFAMHDIDTCPGTRNALAIENTLLTAVSAHLSIAEMTGIEQEQKLTSSRKISGLVFPDVRHWSVIGRTRPTRTSINSINLRQDSSTCGRILSGPVVQGAE